MTNCIIILEVKKNIWKLLKALKQYTIRCFLTVIIQSSCTFTYFIQISSFKLKIIIEITYILLKTGWLHLSFSTPDLNSVTLVLNVLALTLCLSNFTSANQLQPDLLSLSLFHERGALHHVFVLFLSYDLFRVSAQGF